jgi:hypothetical protein
MGSGSPAVANQVTVIGLSRVEPAEYDAQWNGRPLRIVLDLSATLRLLGDARDFERADVLSLKSELVAQAAQQLIDAGIEKPSTEAAKVLISAIDLDVGASKSPLRRHRFISSLGQPNQDHERGYPRDRENRP